MRDNYTYEVHKAVETHRVRHQERHFGHLRELKSVRRGDGLVNRMTGGLGRMRSLANRRRAISYETQLLVDQVCRFTDNVCRLTDGSTGRLAICQSDGEQVEICVPAYSSR